MLTQKAKHAFRALLMLGEQPPGKPLLIGEIAAAQDLPKKFLELILLELKHHGILHSKRGKHGGYVLARDPSEITFGEVVRIIDGPIASVFCASQSAYRRCAQRLSALCRLPGRSALRDPRGAAPGISGA